MPPFPISARVDDSVVVASGFVLLDLDNVLTFEIAGLQFEIVFADDEGGEPGLEREAMGATALRIRLKNFKNPLGTAFGPAEICTLQGRTLFMSVYVTALGERLRPTSYCLTMT